MKTTNAIEKFKAAHPVGRSTHTGKWGWRRTGGCLDLSQCIHSTKRAAEMDRAEAARAAWDEAKAEPEMTERLLGLR